MRLHDVYGSIVSIFNGLVNFVVLRIRGVTWRLWEWVSLDSWWKSTDKTPFGTNGPEVIFISFDFRWFYPTRYMYESVCRFLWWQGANVKGYEVEVEGRRGYSGSGSFSFIPPIDSDSFLYPFFLAFSPLFSLSLFLFFSINHPRRRLPPRRRNNQKIPYIRRVVVGLSSGYVPLVTGYPKSTVTIHTLWCISQV